MCVWLIPKNFLPSFQLKSYTNQKYELMNKYWTSIINKIEQKYNIQNAQDWNNMRLREFQTSLKVKLKKHIVENDTIATSFFKDNDELEVFLKLNGEQRTRKLEEYLSSTTAPIVEDIEIDTRTLQKYLISKEIIPNHKRIRNAFSIYVSNLLYEHSLIKFEPTAQENYQEELEHKYQINKKVIEYYDTSWWVYYYHYDEKRREGMLGKALLIIKNKDNVYLQNVPDETATHFEGRITIDESVQHLYIDLLSSNLREKHLRITLFCGIGKVHPLMLGVYTNIYSTNATVAGSIVFQRIESPDSQILESKALSFDNTDCNEINPSIIDFLRDREKNFIKSPSNILTVDSLQQWLQKRK